jgi:hypothetical protein
MSTRRARTQKIMVGVTAMALASDFGHAQVMSRSRCVMIA